MDSMSKEELCSKLEQSARHGQNLLTTNISLEKELEDLREKLSEKEDQRLQEVFQLKRKLEVANNTLASLQEDATERSILRKNSEDNECARLRKDTEILKKNLDDKNRTLELEIEERDRRIKFLESQISTKDKCLEEIDVENRRLKADQNLAVDAQENERSLVASVDELTKENSSLKTELRSMTSREERLSFDIARLKRSLEESEAEKDHLCRKLNSCENDVSRLKEDILGLEQLLENERMSQGTGREQGNSLFGELDDQRRKAEEAFALLKGRYERLEENYRLVKGANQRLKDDVESLMLLSCAGRVDAKEYGEIEKEIKMLKVESREKEERIWELMNEMKSKNSELERLRADALKNERKKGEKGRPEDRLVDYYRNCVENQKEETEKIEKRWKDEITEKLLAKEENSKLKFENAKIKRDVQKQKAENFKLTMKMNEMKAASEETTSSNQPPPTKKQKVVVEKKPEDWKIVEPPIDSTSGAKSTTSGASTKFYDESTVLSSIDGDANTSGSERPTSPLEDKKLSPNRPVKQKLKILTQEEAVMKPDECGQQ